MICLCFLSTDKNYRNHTFLNLISKVWFQENWIKTQVLIDSECESFDTINMKYVQRQHLKTQKLEHDKVLRNFNEKITWITYLVIVKLQFDKHVKYVELYVHDLKNKYDMILRFQWLKWYNSWIDWIHKIMKFDMQYCQSNYLHELSWYVHNHDYMNMIWYELSLSDNMILFQDNNESLISSQNMILSENNKHVLLKIHQIQVESFYMLTWKQDHEIFIIIMKNIKKALELKSYTNS